MWLPVSSLYKLNIGNMVSARLSLQHHGKPRYQQKHMFKCNPYMLGVCKCVHTVNNGESIGYAEPQHSMYCSAKVVVPQM